jgi:hypothetical protein
MIADALPDQTMAAEQAATAGPNQSSGANQGLAASGQAPAPSLADLKAKQVGQACVGELELELQSERQLRSHVQSLRHLPAQIWARNIVHSM